jgi:hypothetical protein
VGFGVNRGVVDGVALGQMFNGAIGLQLDWISGEGYVCSAGSIHGRRQGLRSPP